jgi:hypothetical protein
VTTYEQVPVDGAGLRAYVRELERTRTNGDVIVARFRIVGRPPGDDWFHSGSFLGTYEQLRSFFCSDGVLAALPRLLGPDPFPPGTPPEFEGLEFGALALDGALASVLASGGAYGRFGGSMADAKRLASDAVHDLLGERYEDVAVYYSAHAWTPWFKDVAWDVTWLLVDHARHEVTMICSTDTD